MTAFVVLTQYGLELLQSHALNCFHRYQQAAASSHHLERYVYLNFLKMHKPRDLLEPAKTIQTRPLSLEHQASQRHSDYSRVSPKRLASNLNEW